MVTEQNSTVISTVVNTEKIFRVVDVLNKLYTYAYVSRHINLALIHTHTHTHTHTH